jgi:hypothetical protein
VTVTSLKTRTNRINQTPLSGLPNVPVRDQTPLERLLALGWDYDEDTDCWLSRLRKNSDGYPVLSLSGHGLHEVGAHRVAFELWRGPIPAGLVVMHSCDRPACINPVHLMAAPQRINLIDMSEKGRAHWQTAKTCRHLHALTPTGVRYADGSRCGTCRRNRKIHAKVRNAAAARWVALAAA